MQNTQSRTYVRDTHWLITVHESQQGRTMLCGTWSSGELNALKLKAEIKQQEILCLNNHGKILFSSSQHCQLTYISILFPSSTTHKTGHLTERFVWRPWANCQGSQKSLLGQIPAAKSIRFPIPATSPRHPKGRSGINSRSFGGRSLWTTINQARFC